MKTFLFTVLIFLSLNAQTQLSGIWVSNSYGTSVTLQFKSENQLIYDGELSYYAASSNIIRIQEEYGFVDYPYLIQHGELKIQFPDGSIAVFVRKKRTTSGTTQTPNQSSNGQLIGWLCSWSGSSGSYSSYSSATHVYFDGTGRFSINSESSFSGTAGLAYGGGSDGGGTYSVNGTQIRLTFQDGSSGVAQVKMQQSNGQITEFMYEGTLYATALCE